MWKIIIFSSILSIALAAIIHDHHDFGEHHHESIESDTDHHHKIEHEHATSHQSFKIHHYHPVPVYVKKEDQHLLKHPIEVSGVNHKLKLLHPETEKSHGHGIVLENHTEEKDHKSYEHYEHHDDHHFEPIQHHDFGHEDEHHDLGHHGHELSHHQFHDINVHHGHHE